MVEAYHLHYLNMVTDGYPSDTKYGIILKYLKALNYTHIVVNLVTE